MPRKPSFTPEEAKERNRERVRAYRERQRALTRLESLALSLLPEGADPYTPPERMEAEAIRAEAERLVARAACLNLELRNRLKDTELAGALAAERDIQVRLAPY